MALPAGLTSLMGDGLGEEWSLQDTHGIISSPLPRRLPAGGGRK